MKRDDRSYRIRDAECLFMPGRNEDVSAFADGAFLGGYSLRMRQVSLIYRVALDLMTLYTCEWWFCYFRVVQSAERGTHTHTYQSYIYPPTPHITTQAMRFLYALARMYVHLRDINIDNKHASETVSKHGYTRLDLKTCHLRNVDKTSR